MTAGPLLQPISHSGKKNATFRQNVPAMEKERFGGMLRAIPGVVGGKRGWGWKGCGGGGGVAIWHNNVSEKTTTSCTTIYSQVPIVCQLRSVTVWH